MFMVLWKWPQDRLTLTAVSCLSPVSTHTLIPASRNASMVSWTLSWSLGKKRKRENKHHVDIPCTVIYKASSDSCM